MAVEDVGLIRNVGIVGQGGGGKTSLADALVFAAGGTTRLGRVDDGTSLFDTEPEEMRRKISLTTAFHHVPWRKHEVTILDMPGYANFLPDALNCMVACSGALFVLEPAAGSAKVEAERLWARAEELALPRIAFVTKMDRENADFEAALRDVREVLQGKPVALHLPIGNAAGFRGMVDVLKMRALIGQPDGSLREEDVPADLAEAAAAARDQLFEAVAEVNDELLEHYLDAGTLTPEEAHAALREGVRGGRFVPVLCGSAAKNIGLPALLDALVDLLPAPAALGPARGEDPKTGAPAERERRTDAPFSAFVFKTIVDPYAGKLSVFQVRSGHLNSDSTVLNVNKESRERIGTIFRLEGKKQQPAPRVVAGEVAAVAKLRETDSGDTLADEKAPIRYPRLLEFSPAISFALAPKSKGDEEKVTQALHKLADEDPTLQVARDAQTKEIILSGVGQLHIEVAVERLKRKYGVEVELQAPKVPYKETIKGKAEAQGKLKKQSGGRGQYGDCWLRIEPLPRGKGFEFVDDIVGGVIPRQYIPAVEKGVREAMAGGVIAGYEMVDVRVTVYDGSYHDVDSSEMAFKIAGSLGFKHAVEKAKPILLEPIMHIEVAVPDECMGDVIGDLNSRRGKVAGVDPKPHGQVIKAHVPMAEVLRYAPDLRSITSGRGNFTIAFSHYEEVPPHLAEKIVKEAEARKQSEQ
jgi:elongation factor G